MASFVECKHILYVFLVVNFALIMMKRICIDNDEEMYRESVDNIYLILVN